MVIFKKPYLKTTAKMDQKIFLRIPLIITTTMKSSQLQTDPLLSNKTITFNFRLSIKKARKHTIYVCLFLTKKMTNSKGR